MKTIKSKSAVLEKIGDSKYFHENWEKVTSAMGRVLSEAYNPKGTMNDWIDACGKVTNELNRLQTLGWSVRHGNTKE